MSTVDLTAFAAERVALRKSEALARWSLLSAVDLSEPLPPIPWICEPLGLAPGAVSLVAGYGYSRKTMAMQSLGLSVAAGKPIWGVYRARSGPFVHLDYEQGRRLTQERYQRLARGMGFELSDLHPSMLKVACMPRVYLDERDASDDLMAICDGAAFVLVDSLRAAFPHADENSSEVRSYLDVLSRVSERTGCAIAVIHHARKPSKDDAGGATMAIRGSSALFDACQSVYVFFGEKGTPTTVHHQKDRVRGACLDDFGIDGEDIARDDDPRWGLRVVHLEGQQVEAAASAREVAREQNAIEKAAAAILVTLRKAGGSFRGSREDLRALSSVKQNNFSSAMAQLQGAGTIGREGKYHDPIWVLKGHS